MLWKVKNALVKCVFIFNWSRMHHGFLMSPLVSTDKKIKGPHSTGCCALRLNLSVDIHWYRLCSLLWCGEITPEVCRSLLDTLSILFFCQYWACWCNVIYCHIVDTICFYYLFLFWMCLLHFIVRFLLVLILLLLLLFPLASIKISGRKTQ